MRVRVRGLAMLIVYVVLLGAGTMAWWFFSGWVRRRAEEELRSSRARR